MRRCAALLAAALVIAAWAGALIAAPSSGAPRFSAVVYAAGSFICHQRPERSFHRHDAQYPVCARCLGLYVGGVVGVLGWIVISGVGPSPRPRAVRFITSRARTGLAIAAFPTVLTALTGMIALWDAGNTMRAALALPLGASVAAVVAAIAAGDMR